MEALIIASIVAMFNLMVFIFVLVNYISYHKCSPKIKRKTKKQRIVQLEEEVEHLKDRTTSAHYLVGLNARNILEIKRNKKEKNNE